MHDALSWYRRRSIFRSAPHSSARVSTYRHSRPSSSSQETARPWRVGRTVDRPSGAGTVVSRAVQDVQNSVKEGESIAKPLGRHEVFPPMVVQMLAVGEETGSIDKMLLRVARYYDQDVDYTIKNLSTAIEPVLLLVLGVAVLFTALAVFLPLWNLMNAFRH